MDRPRLRRWLGAIEQPHPLCPFCRELAAAGDHAACLLLWQKLLALAFPLAQFGPDDDCEHDSRPQPCPCAVVSREARVNVLAARYHHGEALWHPEDLCRMPDLAGCALEVSRLANGAIAEGEVRCG